MKKTFVFCIIILLTISCLISCQQSETLYDVLISSDIKGISVVNDNTVSMRQIEYTNNAVPAQKTEKILGIAYDLNYVYSIKSDIDVANCDIYFNNDVKVYIGYSAKTGKLSKIWGNDPEYGLGEAFKCVELLPDTEQYKNWVVSIVENTFDISCEDYDIVFKTHLDNEIADGFIADNVNAIRYFSINFTKHYGKYESAEQVRIIAQPNGDITSMVWFDFAGVSVSELIVDEAKLNKTIEKKVESLNFEDKLAGYTVERAYFTLCNGKPYLMCDIELSRIDTAGDPYEDLIMIAIDVQS